MKFKLYVAAAMLLAHAFPIRVAIADPLTRPALLTPLASQRTIQAVVTAGAQLIAVGQRGHILRSSDQGQQWVQAPVPLASDLTSVQFVDARNGYAVGHDGVVLASHDGGEHWIKLLDGRQVNALVMKQLQSQSGSPARDRALVEAQHNMEAGPEKPFLDLWFTSPEQGFIVGAYNLILFTSDGGKSWTSWSERSENEQRALHQYAIRPHKGQLFIAGESGLLLRLDTKQQRWVRLDSGYKGSFFGLLDTGDALIAYGMRGRAYVTRDEGRHWSALNVGLAASITAAGRGPDGSLWLGDQTGAVVTSRDGGASFQLVKVGNTEPITSMALTSQRLVLGTFRGLQNWPLPKH